MSTAGQLWALGVKDLQIAKRSKCRCCCELLVPLFVFPFLVLGLFFVLRNGKTVDFKSTELTITTHEAAMQYAFFTNLTDANFQILNQSATDLGMPIQHREPTDHDDYENIVVNFEEFDPHTPKFRYTLWSEETEFGEDFLYPGITHTGWRDNNPFDTEAFISAIDDVQSSFPEKLLVAQHMVDALLLNTKQIKLTDATINFMPTQSYKWNGYNAALPYIVIVIVAASLIPQALVAKDVITEVEAEIKVYLMIMGMSRVSYYASHFVNGCIKVCVIMLILMLPVACALRFTSAITFLFFVFFFSIFAVAYALFWSSILQKPGLCMTVIILSSLLLCVFAFVAPQNALDMGMMSLCSLNPVFAVKAGLHDLRFYDRHGTFPWPGNRMGYQFNVFFAFLFLIFDTIVLILLTLLLDFVIPSAGQPGLTMAVFKKRKHKVASTDDEKVERGDFESIRRRDADADVAVHQLRKRWDFGDYAVNGVDFAAYRGEITCLLGHNGAGKSTVFSCLTGHTKPTSGTVLVQGKNVLSDLSEIRRHLGYCPQSNPLYDRLTCAEHLRLAARLRGAEVDDNDVAHTLGAVGLWNQFGVLASQLSGGMKRKLCVAMALVGKSRVVLLDEPTAGMDPTARKQIGEILDKFKEDRTIILTTHYMDEADRLSDRIVILVKGRVVCNGSSEFLKKRFGTGFLLTISLAHGQANAPQKAERILEVARHHVPEAKFSGSPAAQFTLNLPYESKVNFSRLFAELEARGQELDIDSFGLSVNTLEQVFIKVGEKAEGESNEELRARIVENANAVRKGDRNRSPSVLKQWWALCIRNFVYWLRHPVRTAIPLVVILFCFVFLLIRRGKTGTELNLDFKGDSYYHELQNVPRSEVFVDSHFHDQVQSLFSSLKQCSLKDGTPTAQNNFDVPPPSLGFRMDALPYLTTNRFLNDAYFLVTNALANMMFGQNSPNTITFGIRANSSGDLVNGVVGPLITNLMNGVFTAFGITFGLAMLLAETVTERVTKFKHQIRLTGCRAPVYWISQLTTDFVYFLILAVVVFAASLIAIKGEFGCSAGVLPVWLAYFFVASLASYVLSFRFESATKGTVFVLAFHTIIPLISYAACIIAIGILSVVARIDAFEHKKGSTSPSLFNILQLILGFVFPAIPLFSTQQQAAFWCVNKQSKFMDNYRMLSAGEASSIVFDQKNIIDVPAARSLISLGVSFFIYLLLLILTESGVIFGGRRGGSQATAPPVAHGFEDDDPDVTVERQSMDSTNDGQLALACRGLYKYYGAKAAVQNLSFGIRPSECFGLLGINGAGKTTTFDILSNINRPSSGRATIGGVSADTTPAIGYCPQFDALSGFLTAADTLRLIGRLNGFEDVEERMQMVLQCVMMEEHANKIVKKCSGGQKRRVSIAVALMSGADCLLMDEPTAGVDPATRRQIWDLLTAVRLQGKAILLTTHSMEECEALCTRIGFLRDGRLRGIGTSQHLKNRYGNSYNLTLILNHVPLEVCAAVDKAVQERFGVPKTTDAYQLAVLSWSIPRRPNQAWSQMYAVVEKLVADINRTSPDAVRDFYLIQDSLEQVFTRLATNEQAGITAVPLMESKPFDQPPIQQAPLVRQPPPPSAQTHQISVVNSEPWSLKGGPQQAHPINGDQHLAGNPDFEKM
ncbi:ABC transporter ced-7 [Aphelenchoides fujianensis]|nr:ABC transporter ced-7 [Aphelenchoides fujianensis]